MSESTPSRDLFKLTGKNRERITTLEANYKHLTDGQIEIKKEIKGLGTEIRSLNGMPGENAKEIDRVDKNYHALATDMETFEKKAAPSIKDHTDRVVAATQNKQDFRHVLVQIIIYVACAGIIGFLGILIGIYKDYIK